MTAQLLSKIWSYAKRQYWELPANILEGITLVLLVFVQDVAFKDSVIICAGLLFVSLALHGLAYRAGQCKVWPKIIEVSAPVPFVAMIPAGYLATVPTQKTGFITINMWFAVVEVVFLLFGSNFMMEYLQDWNPREVWGTPLLQRSAAATAAVWIICQVLMAAAQGLAYAFNLSIDNGSNVAAAIFVCYVMQLLPLVVAIIFTFAYPASLKKRWGYVKGVRSTCYPPPKSGIRTACEGDGTMHRVVDMSGGESRVCLLCSSSFLISCSSGGGGKDGGGGGVSKLCKGCSSSQQSMSSSGSGGSEDVMVCISPREGEKRGAKRHDSSGGDDSGSTVPAVEPQMQQQEQQQQQQELQQQQPHQHQR